jgi:two-component system nitrogen regulation response regulator GlnG
VGSILLVDSDPDTRSRLGLALRDARHSVITAHTLADASQRLREGGIDLVIVDTHDPRLGTVELARSMESLPDTPPIVLVSDSPSAPEISARIGAAAFVPKPIDMDELVAIVDRLAGQARPVRVIDEFGDDEPTGPARQLG